MSEVRERFSPATASDNVGPMRLSTENQFGSLDRSLRQASDNLVQSGALPGLHLNETDPLVSPPGERGRATSAVEGIHHSARITAAADGSFQATVQQGDNLWRIAREALGQNKEEGYRPSNQEVAQAVAMIARENQIQNPNLIHPGDVIRLPHELTDPRQRADHAQAAPTADQAHAAQANADQPADTPVLGPYAIHGSGHHVSREFAMAVQAQFNQLPDGVNHLLSQNRFNLSVGGTVADAAPSLAHARDGASGSAVADGEDGAFDAAHKTIVVAQNHLDASGARVRNPDVPGTIAHETGHAFDAALGNMSHSDDFKRALDADLARMRPEDKARFANMVQDSDAGREEAFAKVFQSVINTSRDANESAIVVRDFSNVANMIVLKMSQLPQS